MDRNSFNQLRENLWYVGTVLRTHGSLVGSGRFVFGLKIKIHLPRSVALMARIVCFELLCGSNRGETGNTAYGINEALGTFYFGLTSSHGKD